MTPGIRLVVAALLLALTACRAEFFDERPTTLTADDAAARAPDLGGHDLGGGGEMASSEVVIADGMFEGRKGHAGQGGAALVRRTDGTMELRLDAAFLVTIAPGPVVVLTSRTEMGTQIDPQAGDLVLGALLSSRGAQAYPLPSPDEGRRNAFVFCKPFGVEIALAPLVDR